MPSQIWVRQTFPIQNTKTIHHKRRIWLIGLHQNEKDMLHQNEKHHEDKLASHRQEEIWQYVILDEEMLSRIYKEIWQINNKNTNNFTFKMDKTKKNIWMDNKSMRIHSILRKAWSKTNFLKMKIFRNIYHKKTLIMSTVVKGIK